MEPRYGANQKGISLILNADPVAREAHVAAGSDQTMDPAGLMKLTRLRND